ncbi:trypsin alpha-like isoform X1 [Diabrotica undecimpunctata]|uniref:trypsin alpha-like isoform X1 n=1 Tax=Diabrotica undecimpunctata TaxID=50387 RepID=UPI003B63963A
MSEKNVSETLTDTKVLIKMGRNWNIACFLCVILLKNNLVVAGSRFRIFGGNLARIEDHPWIVSLVIPGFGHNCGGSLINEDTVLTAAHCVRGVESISVVAGTSRWADSGNTIGVKNISIHEKYASDGHTAINDIAIIKLAEKVKYSEKIKPINLPEQGLKLTEGTSLVVAGWGKTAPEESSSEFLLETEVTVSKCECDDIIIAGERYSGICRGDSGGPLELGDTIVGIVSSGAPCKITNIPAEYMNVAYFRTWIEKTLNALS